MFFLAVVPGHWVVGAGLVLACQGKNSVGGFQFSW